MTGNDLVKSIMRMTGALASGENPSADEASDVLSILNLMLDDWSSKKVSVFTTQRQVFNLVVNQQVYQMGSGAPDFNVPRPPHINNITIINISNPLLPLELSDPEFRMVEEIEWAEIRVKNITSALPKVAWDDQAFPFRNISYYPVPSVPVQTAIYTNSALNQFPDLATDLTFPPGYLEAIKYNGAVRAGAEKIGRPATSDVVALAISSFKNISAANIRKMPAKTDEALSNYGGHGYNWLIDR